MRPGDFGSELTQFEGSAREAIARMTELPVSRDGNRLGLGRLS